MKELIIRPLSGNGKDISYVKELKGISVKWGNIVFEIDVSLYNKILNEFFIDTDKWYLLGASMTVPIRGGLGEYVSKISTSFNPRYASAIAAIMVNEKHLIHKGIKPIELKRIK